MGTNYYLRKNMCPHCGRGDEVMHIGKSSAGWCFSLHVYPEKGIHDFDDWKPLLNETDAQIHNEYGEIVTVDDMLGIITQRGKVETRWDAVPMMYSSWDEFHRRNCSEKGPEGLLRHKLMANHCIKQGEGTWDCIVGEFS